jgi:hypothetical protein
MQIFLLGIILFVFSIPTISAAASDTYLSIRADITLEQKKIIFFSLFNQFLKGRPVTSDSLPEFFGVFPKEYADALELMLEDIFSETKQREEEIERFENEIDQEDVYLSEILYSKMQSFKEKTRYKFRPIKNVIGEKIANLKKVFKSKNISERAPEQPSEEESEEETKEESEENKEEEH